MIDRIKDKLRNRSPLHVLIWSLWALLLISIPVTSSPWVADITGHTTVSPLAGFPLALLVFCWLIPHLLRRGNLPSLSTPLLIFVGVALLTSALIPFREIYPFLSQTVNGRVLRGLATLAIGVCFYLIAWHFSRSEQSMRHSLGWLYLGGVVLLVWASLQAYYIAQDNPFPSWFQKIHRLFSIRDMSRGRVSGLAYEPSWLGDLLVVLYLPLWFSSVIHRYSVLSRKATRFSIELGLLLWGTSILFASHSRIALLGVIATLGVLGLIFGWHLMGRGIEALKKKWPGFEGGVLGNRPILLRLALWVLLVLVVIVVGLAVVGLSSLSDWRLERVFGLNYLEILQNSQTPMYTIAEMLAFAERVMYWEVGLGVFHRYPILGVGLGGSGFFFREYVPAYAYHLPELIRRINGAPGFPNPKNLWIRLLAETGIVGFLVFSGWLLRLALGAIHLFKKEEGWRAMIGFAGLLALVIQVFEGFSLDTFALPQLWMILGFLSSAISPSSDGHKIPEAR